MSKGDTIEKLRRELQGIREARTSLRDDLYDFLSDGRSSAYGFDDEQIGEALLLLATWRATKELSKSSSRLEKVTWVLTLLTVVLIALTATLAYSALN